MCYKKVSMDLEDRMKASDMTDKTRTVTNKRTA